jgi:solute carrier family 25 (mitochondrial phosphate transporter), member 23/24/25/41
MHIPIVSICCESKLKKMLTSSSDVLRRRFQINTMSGIGYQYKSIFDAVRVIVTQEGIKGLYKGIVPNLLKVAPSMASSWLSFEMTRDFLLTLRADTDADSETP